MIRLERFNERRHSEEIISADIEHELGGVEIAVEIGKIVDLRHGEAQSAIDGIVVGPVLPRRKNAFLNLGGGSLNGGGGLGEHWRREQRQRG